MNKSKTDHTGKPMIQHVSAAVCREEIIDMAVNACMLEKVVVDRVDGEHVCRWEDDEVRHMLLILARASHPADGDVVGSVYRDMMRTAISGMVGARRIAETGR
mgnify:CR=1 FL=1|tara:strand:+ start:2160 stop:2468 length:309 start_codon:yes stop_codon:yes gene_type:complete